MCDCATELLHQLRDSERNFLKDNLALRNNSMDLVAFDGNYKGSSSAVDIEVEGGLFFGSTGKMHIQLAVANVD
ncbi:hypothetical protein PVK06_030867 [Gossypium arboreum]|uniref:Uncharacterized protein n=1 Tax=Gossypium arboreum TaxID=29729 RepID=A0ABR0NQ03_GOSAR|nr:hypothetical protein PVK06_030867 [Gossypium arboreum]